MKHERLDFCMALSTRGRVLIAFGIVAALVLVAAAYYARPSPAPRADQLRVVASFYPYQYMAARVGGDLAQVTSMVPPGVEPHDWEPTPDAIAQVHEADIFVFNGYAETFLSSLFAGLPAASPVRVNTSVGLEVRVTENGEVDPHLWLDPVLAQGIVDAIEASFSSVRPASAASFHANAQQLRAELAAIDALYESGLHTCTLDTFVSQHEAFGYVSARYDLVMVAIQGLSPDEQPPPVKLAEIQEVIQATGVQYIFYEELVDPSVAETLANEAGIGTLVLSPLEGLTPEWAKHGHTFLSLSVQNLVHLRTALECT